MNRMNRAKRSTFLSQVVFVVNIAAMAAAMMTLSGCAGVSQPQRPMTPVPSSFYEIPVPREHPHEGSLFTPGREGSIYSDFRARNVGDVITILIAENLKAANDAATQTQKDSNANLGLTGILGLIFSKNSTVNPSNTIGGSATDKYNGSGKSSRNASFTGTISARVVQVLPDGNLLVEGSRELKINNETQYLTLSGVVRPKDLSSDNTVPSTRLADARIEYTGGGVLSDKQGPGWLVRLLDMVAPF
ncbi:MAG: flagellar basal body L-ring protein FlgH [Dissulfurimicrobium sp.]|uniref:flagellar basal body L-ring protein FlgH n=1 Tax=Dissulfurimicrobium TaxID=1769732 RepID=UPI003C76E10B